MSTAANIITKLKAIPRRHIFMMGNGQPVPPKRTKRFCSAIVEGCMDGKVIGHYDFLLGFAACFDAIARGTIDDDADPVAVALQAYYDVHNITDTPNLVTDIMREAA